ncbi:unnamed protein product [Nesidiocoris tenuis]|uniref:Uncharacterized protein n=1 Tax=Nesidiocoris tenuis TaxID=355587 RepID=A0A6H5GUE1_9HEMI|nr:unnamed protein product [Nesidiocoris tenuis]
MTTRKPLPNHRWSSPTLTSFSWILEELEEASNLGLMSILATTDLWSERILLPQHPTSRPLVRHQSDSSNHGQQNHHHLHLTLLHHLLQVSRFMEDFHSFLSEKTFLGIISKKKTSAVSGQQTSNSNNDAVSDAPGDDELIYDEMVDLGKEMFESERIVGTSMGGNSGPHAAAQHLNPSSSVEPPSPQPSEESKNVGGDDLPLTSFQEAPLRSSGVRDNSQERFPHGPRNLDVDSLPLGSSLNARKRRSVVVSDRKTRSADVGVSGLYEVISEADLAFTPDSKGEAVTVFQGRIREEVVYGICLPVPNATGDAGACSATSPHATATCDDASSASPCAASCHTPGAPSVNVDRLVGRSPASPPSRSALAHSLTFRPQPQTHLRAKEENRLFIVVS